MKKVRTILDKIRYLKVHLSDQNFVQVIFHANDYLPFLKAF